MKNAAIGVRVVLRLASLAMACVGLFAAAYAAPASTSPMVELGATLFSDKALSATGTISCASCHERERAFSDGKPVSIGVHDRAGTRNAPSLLGIASFSSFFWDGRRESLEAQVMDPFTNPREHGLSSEAELIRKVSGTSDYRARFMAAFGEAEITSTRIAEALAAFVRSLAPQPSRFDDYWSRDKREALSENERRGLEVFRGQAGCATCHTLDAGLARLSDDRFHSLGIERRVLQKSLGDAALRSHTTPAAQRDALITADADVAALGRFNVTRKPADIGKFRTPSLRNVAVTGPYMHDGSVATLEEAVEMELYYRSAELGRAIVLTPAEKANLVAFLRALTSTDLERESEPR